MPELIVTTTEAGLSVETFLQQRIPSAPLAYLRKLLKDGKIRRTSDVIVADTLLAAGEHIMLPDSRRLADLLEQSERISIAILCETDHLLIVDKPAGLATHAGQGHQQDNLTARVAGLLKHRGQTFMAAPIQRLDLETSGPVLFGKGKKSCSLLGQMMMTEKVEKTYLALVSGHTDDNGILVSEIPAKGKTKTAETAYQTVERSADATLLRIELRTGRQHQIRLQFSKNGHPLFGDRRYNGPCPEKLHRLFLHCTGLSFVDPFTEQPLTVSSPLPTELSEFLDNMGFQTPVQSSVKLRFDQR